MTLTQFGLSFGSIVFFLICVIGVVIPLWKRKSENLLLISLSWGVSLALLVSVFIAQIVAPYLFVPTVPPEFQYILLLSIGVVLIMPILFGSSLKWQCLFLYLFCCLGTIALPDTLFGFSDVWHVTGIRLFLAAIWTFLILTVVELDRVPLEGFVLSMAYFLLFLLMSTGVLNILPESMFNVFVQTLTIILLVLLIYKRYTFVWLGFPMMFVLFFISGYVFCRLAVTFTWPYVLIMLSYPLAEGFAALGLNIYHHRRALPILVPLIPERGFAIGVSFKTVVLRIFYIVLLTGLIGVLGLRTDIRFFAISVFMTVLVLYAGYLRTMNNQSKVSLRSVKDDAKKGLSVLWQEFKTVPLKQLSENAKTVVSSKKEKTSPELRSEKTEAVMPEKKKSAAGKKQEKQGAKQKSVRKTKSTRMVGRIK